MYKSAVVTLDPIGVKTTSKSTMSSSEPVGDEPPVPKDSSVKLAPTLNGTLPHVRPGGRRKKRSSMGRHRWVVPEEEVALLLALGEPRDR